MTPARSRYWPVLALALSAFAGAALADAQSPYAGMERRPLKALSQAEIDDLRAGRGLGMAMPAELNGYPGPRHVLDLADALALSAEQRGRTEALFGAMQAEAGALGHALLEREAAVERLFASGDADEAGLRAAVGEAARLRGELRYAHLRYHLAMRALLTQAQIALYDRHRGYSGQAHPTPGGHRPH